MTSGFDNISELYLQKGMSMSEIANKYKMTVWKVVNYMRKNNIARRTSAETQKLQFERKPMSYMPKAKLTKSEQILKLVGLSLYWAEGAKTGGDTVDIANSDERIVSLFLTMLRSIYLIDEKRLRVFLYCHVNQNPDELISFWSNKLKISKHQFTKPYVKFEFKRNKVNKMPKGLVHIRYNDRKLFKKIMEDIGIIATQLV